jgi:L-seryl-tRNA(Ser) seleniumtransferase
VDVVTPEDVEKAVNERTALMFFMNVADPRGQIKRQQWADLARRHKVPTLLDAAADVPPREHLAEYINKVGFDMVAISGGKAIRGPNNTGLLLGRKEFIDTAKRNTSPNEGRIGRMLKVSKEEIMACLAAVDRYVHIDPKEEEKEWQGRISVIVNRLKDIPTIEDSQSVPEIANHVPHLYLSWDQKQVKISPSQVSQELRAGDPSIILGGGGPGGGGRRGPGGRGPGGRADQGQRAPGGAQGRGAQARRPGIGISVFMLKDGEDRIIADRLHAILKKAAT